MSSPWGRGTKSTAAATAASAKEKLSRRAVDDIEYEEITDVFELLGAAVRGEAERSSKTVGEVRVVAERLVTKTAQG